MSIPRNGSSSFPLSNPRSMVFYAVTGKVAGRLRVLKGRICLYKTVRDDHQLYAPPAWAEDRAALSDAVDSRAEFMVLKERRAGCWWVAPCSAFEKHGFRVDRGHGVQVALPLRCWQSGFDLEALFQAIEGEETSGDPGPERQVQLFEPTPAA